MDSARIRDAKEKKTVIALLSLSATRTGRLTVGSHATRFKSPGAC
jgi:hypothetical protein